MLKGLKRVLYYDNFEPYVPGGYSQRMGLMVKNGLDAVIFASAPLATQAIFYEPTHEIDFKNAKRYGIGFYALDRTPIDKASRKKEVLRSDLLKKCALESEDPITLLYLGGANTVFYEEALPDLLEILETSELPKKTILLYQRHPRADDIDLKKIEAVREALDENNITVLISPYSIDEAIVLADKVLYFQTTVIPKCLLEKKGVIQIAKVPYSDFAIRHSFVQSVNNSRDFIRAILMPTQIIARDAILKSIGYDKRWDERFISIIEKVRRAHG